MKLTRWAPLGLFLLLAFLAAAIGGFATSTSVDTWYATLRKPTWSPPDAVFGPVWTLLYIFMAVAAWLVWLRGNAADAKLTFRLYGAQLGLNALWSILFFGLRQPAAAFIDILVLWFVLIRLYVRFRESDRLAGWLWLPYLLWVTFAVMLNASIWQMNR